MTEKVSSISPSALFEDGPEYVAGWGSRILCPVCRFEYCHIGEVTEQVSDNYEAWQGRGEAVRIHMSCENGHHWTLRLGFHKGHTFCAIEDVAYQGEPG